jgi:hypothetical protein
MKKQQLAMIFMVLNGKTKYLEFFDHFFLWSNTFFNLLDCDYILSKTIHKIHIITNTKTLKIG